MDNHAKEGYRVIAIAQKVL